MINAHYENKLWCKQCTNTIEVIKEGAFCGTSFRGIYPGVNVKRYRKSWKEFDELKSVEMWSYCSSYYDVSLNKYGVKCAKSLIF